jgi:hypothetical protein
MRSKSIRYSALILGILVAVSIILSHSFHASVTTEKTKTEKTAEKENETEQATLTISATSLPSPTVTHFSHAAFCLFEIVFVEDASATTEIFHSVPLNKFFSTLLSVIISPNAP